MKRKKHAITLLEIMIVIFLIGIIGGVVGYNMKDSLAKGKAMKTKLAIEKIREILYLEAAEREISIREISLKPEEYLQKSGFFKNQDKILVDGWGEAITVSYDDQKNDLRISSAKLNAYERRKAVQ